MPPLVEQLAPDARLGSDRRNSLPSLEPKHNLLLQLRRILSWWFRHGPSSEAMSPFLPGLTFGVHSSMRYLELHLKGSMLFDTLIDFGPECREIDGLGQQSLRPTF